MCTFVSPDKQTTYYQMCGEDWLQTLKRWVSKRRRELSLNYYQRHSLQHVYLRYNTSGHNAEKLFNWCVEIKSQSSLGLTSCTD